MLYKIYYKNKFEIVLVFINRSPVTLYSGEGMILELLDEFLSPLDSECVTLSEYIHRVKVGEGDTEVINLDEVA